MSAAVLWGELLGFGLAVAFSPVHIALLLLLLLGPQPLRRGGWFVVTWLVASALMLLALLALGHGLLLTMEKGSSHRTGLDLLAAGALLALGLRELLEERAEGAEPPAWSLQLNRFVAMPLAPLLAVSVLFQLLSPDDLFLYAKASGSLLAAGLGRGKELLAGGAFCLSTGLFLMLPLAALLLLGPERVVPGLRAARDWLLARGDLLMGLVSLALAAYLGWEGIEGLRLS
ncbi:MAG: GAP family protein [Synechococcaceae cyanobacterium]|nr:GAP family protein [Synechococcaceae cyanobacterium]